MADYSALVAQIKTAIRISHSMLDSDITANINAALLDMGRVGIDSPDVTDALVAKAIEVYYKWQNDYEGKADEHQKHYEKLRDAISLCSDYNGEN